MWLVDTNVVSEMRKVHSGKAAVGVAAWSKQTPPGSMFLSAITVLELELGVLAIERRDPASGAVLRTWLEERVLRAFEGRVLPVDIAVARRCASLHVPDPRPERDALIAATALVHRMTVVTRNVRDFEPTGAAVLDPWEFEG
jgi:predicted nucleic acid-binding protein